MNQLSGRQRLPTEPRITTFAGGGGGIGRSTIAVEVARFLVRRGRRVLLIDADIDAPELHIRLEQTWPREPAWKTGGRSDVQPAEWILPGDRSRPALLPLAWPCRRALTAARLDVPALLARLRGLDYDHVIIDARGTPDTITCDLFVLADVPVLCATTEPASLHRATGFLRSAVLAALYRHGTQGIPIETMAAVAGELSSEWDVEELGEVCARLGLERPRAAVARDFGPYLLLTQTRETAEREQGWPLALSWSYLLGVRPRVLGSIDYDDRRWFHLRQDVLLPQLASDAGTGVQLEEIARRIAEIHEIDREQPRRVAGEVPAAVDLVCVAADCEPTAARAAYRRLWEGLRRDSSLSRRLLQHTTRERIVRDLEDANRELQAWLQERSPVRLPGPDDPGPRRPPDRQPGEAIVAARNRLGLSQRDVSLRTKIDVKHLDAIEKFRVDQLPRAAYLRGYLREIAQVLEMTPEPLMDQYLDAVASLRTERLLTGSRPAIRQS